ncbi:MAG: type II/IV secretion system ATPase subunit [Methanomicrobiales archaeon]|nr:type II/IV secretion system ATPase subunit [Methanomicrobiales archaeon]
MISGPKSGGQAPAEAPASGAGEDDEARLRLGGLIQRMKRFEDAESREAPAAGPAAVHGAVPGTEPAPPQKAEAEPVILPPSAPSAPPAGGGAGEDEATFRSLIDDLIRSHDEVIDDITPYTPTTGEPVEIDLPPAETAPPTAASAQAQRTQWSGGGDNEVSEGVVTVDDIDDYTNMILPKGATFEVEDLHLASSSAFDLVDKGSVLSEIDEIWKPVLPAGDIEASPLGGIEAAGEEPGEKGRLGFLRGLTGFSKHRGKIVEYQPSIHGPMVDLSFVPAAGQEEVELYPVNEPYAYVRIIYDNTNHTYLYSVIEPELSDAEKELLVELQQRLFETLDVNTKDMTRDAAKKALRNAIDEIILDYGIKLTPASREKVLYNIEKEFLGDGLIDPVMHDKYIEDISCDGLNTPIFIYHTSYESIQTTLKYTDANALDSFVTKLAQRAGKYISIAEPMLDATMSDGSRIQMTLGQEVTAHGSTFTIRKFRDEPITPTDLIEWSTFSPLSIAFIWLAVENGKSCIFCGGTASGKTTSLNAISLFIPPLAKIVTLEDTRELKLPHPNWIPSVTRESFDSAGKGSIDMYELLRAALRQRPEYILVGEVRGQEALTLFQAMSTGHVTYATMHADSVSSAVHRLENPPLNVPRNMLNALDLVSVQVQARIGGQRIRRNKQLIEILDIDPRTNELITNEVFKWHPATDEIRYSGKSYILEEIMEERGWSEARMREELKRRQEILEWMRIKKLRHYKDVAKVLISYYRDPEAVMDIVRGDLYE